MNTTQQGILVLMKSAVTGERLSLPEDFSLSRALPLIQAHHIIPLAYAGAVHCGLTLAEPAMQQLLLRSGKLMLSAEKQMQAIEAVYRAFETHGIDYMPVKGCLMKGRYPSPELRPMGDADILIRTEQYDRIRPILTELGLQETVESDHELIWKSTDLYLELHKRLIPSYNRDYYAYFGDGWRLASRREGCRCSMSQEDEYIYLFTHFAKHYRDGGIGCRHVLDLWVMDRWMTQPDRAYIRRELKKLCLDRFHDNMKRVMDHWFEGCPSDDVTELISQFIMGSGSWGGMEAHVLSMEARKAKDSGSKVRALLAAVFPPAWALENKYRILRRRRWMLPFVWGWRWVHTVLFERRNIRKTVKKLNFIDPESVSTYQRSLNAVGLEFRFEE